MNSRYQILSSSTDEHCKTRSYLFPLGCLIYAFLRGGRLMENEQHPREIVFLHADMARH